MGVIGWSDIDQAFMRQALEEASAAAMAGEIPVGAIVVRNNELIGSGRNRSIQDSDPTAHAEVVAIRAASQALKNYRLNDATIYATLEPCSMCVGAMLQARIGRLVFGAYDDKAGAAGSVLDLTANSQLNHRVEVNGGLLKEPSRDLLRQFFASRRD